MKQVTVISGKGGTGKTTILASLAALVKRAVLTDGLVDAFSKFNLGHFERTVSRFKDLNASDICKGVLDERDAIQEQSDDISLVVIKRN